MLINDSNKTPLLQTEWRYLKGICAGAISMTSRNRRGNRKNRLAAFNCLWTGFLRMSDSWPNPLRLPRLNDTS
jgi:hypothetical protein